MSSKWSFIGAFHPPNVVRKKPHSRRLRFTWVYSLSGLQSVLRLSRRHLCPDGLLARCPEVSQAFCSWPSYEFSMCVRALAARVYRMGNAPYKL